ncbi:MAG TPA: FHA domain-containing protein, partial [Caulobacteraceae bacterium]|nr:FHA domain-containing protein [Caulobacteraceae bacterium]
MANADDDKTRPNIPRPSDDEDKTRAYGAGGYYDDGEDDDDEDDDVTRAAIPGASGKTTEKAGRILIQAGKGTQGPSVVYPSDTASQPVCALLLIIKGPGLGIGVPISYGRTSFGRANGARAQLALGDSSLSGLHFIISFDEADGSFDLREADAATNSTYLNGERVRQTMILKAG